MAVTCDDDDAGDQLRSEKLLRENDLQRDKERVGERLCVRGWIGSSGGFVLGGPT